MTLFFLFLACTAGIDDSADSGGDTSDDTGTATPVSLDALLPAVDHAWGCSWVYLVAEAGGYVVVSDLQLPEADELTRGPLSYDRPLEATDSLKIGGGPGEGELSVFDCSDVMDSETEVRVWTASAATLSIEATYVEERPEWTCDGVSDNPVYNVSVTVTDAVLTDENGDEGTLSAWGPLEVEVADYCGG